MQISDVITAIFRETSRYDQMHLRPYTTVNYNSGVAAMLSEATSGGSVFDASSLSAVASNFLGYQSQSAGVANISNGFDTKRFSFVLKFVDTNTNTSGRTITVLTGYTDHMGATANQVDISNISLDANMRMYFNNLITLRERPMNTPHGIQMQTNMISARQILFNSGMGQYMNGVEAQYTLRPEDVMQHMSFANDEISSQIYADGGFDASSMLSSVRPSSRSHSLPASYLAMTMEKYVSATQTEMGKDDFDDTAVYRSAKQKLREVPLMQNALLRTLIQSGNFNEMGYATMGELMRAYPHFDYVAEVHYNDMRAKQMEYSPGQAAGWGGMDNETIVGNSLQQMVPAIMSDCMVSRIAFTATNDVIGGKFDVRIGGYASFIDNMDMTHWLITLRERIITEVLLPISHQGHIILAVTMEVQMDGDARINISYDGGPTIPYVAPMFCDSLYPPVISNSHDSVSTVASDMDTMLLDINGDLRRMAMHSGTAVDMGNNGGASFTDNFIL